MGMDGGLSLSGNTALIFLIGLSGHGINSAYHQNLISCQANSMQFVPVRACGLYDEKGG